MTTPTTEESKELVDLSGDGYTFCGLHVMMGGKQFEDVWVKYDNSGVVAALIDIRDKNGDKVEL